MEIKTFSDIVKEIGLPQQILDGIEQRLYIATNGVDFQFTDLQKNAFNQDGYWIRSNKKTFPPHILVQGATSSGKTLVSEMSVIECLCEKPKKRVIILVPLKAMVRERRDHFANDLPDERVYASSSDFQDHDADIINGNYDVAVIVYEKFFAMLSQPSNQILNDCALLVVDELQMLNSEGRGPKLEISIQKVMRHNAELGTDNPLGTYTRIMCLTTCDCKVDYIKQWLTIGEQEPLSIKSESRPVGLEEYVLNVNGVLRGRYIKGERDKTDKVENFNEYPEPIQVENYDKNNRSETAKRLVLLPLIKNIYQKNPEAKVLIFVSDRKKTRDIAEYLARENILQYGLLSEETIHGIQNYDNDEGQEALKRLIPYGIAYHNSTLSTALREFIEKSFEKDIRLVVATETLTIGMNMPVDVMILYDMKVPRGKEVLEELTSQEYKNFAGRAGRLGQSNCVGKSYILALNESEASVFWDSFINCRMEDIKSSLLLATEDVQAPYYLSLLTAGKKYRLHSLDELKAASFSTRCGGRQIKMNVVMKELRKAALCTQKEIINLFDDEEDDELDLNSEKKIYEYELSEIGQLLAPYALSLDTCKQIRRYFLNGGYRKYKTGIYEEKLQPGDGGVPQNITAKDIETDRYLLDILFLLCSTKEITNLSQLRIPGGDNARIAKNIVWSKLESMISLREDSESQMCELWPESHLQYILDGYSNHETEDLQTVMRAILLWYWTKGSSISEIKRKTGFGKFLPIYSGDMARLAELVSYELDAIYRCTSNFTKSIKVDYDERGPAAIYALSTRVNYGMPRNLVIIANRHLYEVDRITVLKIGEAAMAGGYDSPVRFLAQATKKELEGIITEQQRNELLTMIERIYLRDDMEGLLDSIQKNTKSISVSKMESNNLKQLYDLKEEDDICSFEVLQEIFWNIDESDSQKSRFFEKSIRIKGDSGKCFEILFDGEHSVTIADCADTESIDTINTYFVFSKRNILLTRDNNLLKQIKRNLDTGRWYFCNQNGDVIKNIDIAMTCKSFAILIAQTIALDDRKGSVLSKFIFDINGIFSPKGVKVVNPLLKNYDSERHSFDNLANAMCIVCDYRNGIEQEACDKLLNGLSYKGIPYRVVSWGDNLNNESVGNAPTVLYITEDSFCSQSIGHFYEKERQHGFKNACAIFDNESQFLNLCGEPQFPANGLAHWSSRNIEEKVQYIDAWYKQQQFKRNGIDTYILGVSYSHTKEVGEVRPAVIALRKIIKKLNGVFGEFNIVFDENESFKDKFDRNGAVPASLELYQKCLYYIVLDDSHYNDGNNCPKEATVIKRQLQEFSESYKQHIWFLRPKNDTGSNLFNQEEDFSIMMDYSDGNIIEIAETISRVILEEGFYIR